MKTRSSTPFIFIILTSLITLAFLNGCSKKKEKEVIKIGVSISNFEDTFISYVKSGMEEYQKEISDKVDMVYLDADEDLQKQEQQVNYFLKQEVDAVIVIPVNTAFTSKMTEIAKKKKTPIVYLNRFPDEFIGKELPEDVYYIGSKEKNAGIMQMEYLAEKLNGKGNIGILMGNMANRATFDRTEGVEEVADRYPEIHIVAKKSGRWLQPFAGSIIEEWLQSGIKFDAIASNNDEMAIGAIKTLEKYGMINEVLVVGTDATTDAIIELEKGNLNATVFQDSQEQGKHAVEAAYEISQGGLVPNINWIPFKLITRDNYKEILN